MSDFKPSDTGYSYCIASSLDIEKPFLVIVRVTTEYNTSGKLALIGFREVDNELELDGRIYTTTISSSGRIGKNTCFAISDNGGYFAYHTDGIGSSGGNTSVGYNAIYTINSEDLSVIKSTEISTGLQARTIYFTDNDRLLMMYRKNDSFHSNSSCYYRFLDDMTKTGVLNNNIAMFNDGRHAIYATDSYGTQISLCNMSIDYAAHTITRGTTIQTLSTGIVTKSSTSYGCLACLCNFDRFLYLDGTFSSGRVGIDIDLSSATPMALHTLESYTSDSLDKGRNIMFPYRTGMNLGYSAIYHKNMVWTSINYKVWGSILNLPLVEQSSTSSIFTPEINESSSPFPMFGQVLFTGSPSNDVILRSGTTYRIVTSKSNLANAIGLTADKIKAGETILGITGTYTGENNEEVNNG